MRSISMDKFLGPTAFAGPFVPQSAVGASFLNQASFSGCIAFSNWPREDVERLLPPEIELGANTSSTPDVHPVVFIFGEHNNGAMMFGGLTFPIDVNYQELGVCIPFVRHKGGTLLHTHMVRMYSGYTIATWNGNFHYGFSKQMARLRWQGPVYVVTSEEDMLLLHATVEAAGGWSAGDSCELPNFAEMRAIFSMPVGGCKVNGTYVHSYFSWDFSDALVRSADSCISIDAPLLNGLSPRICHDVTSGTFEVRRMVWRLSWPLPARV